MRDKKCAGIEKYLSDQFPGCQIERKHDFDRGAETFRIHVPDGTLLLKVAGEFMDDNEIQEIIARFKQWTLAAILAQEKQGGVLATQDGLSTFHRG